MEEVKKYILENGGITLNNNGEICDLKNGYIVSTPSYEFITEKINTTISQLNEYLKIIKGCNDLYVGAWYNNGLYYVDINIYCKNKKDAVRIAKNNLQLAIFDLKKGTAIDLNYNISFYTMYDKHFNYKMQFDSLDEISNYLNISKNYLKVAISQNKLINNKYLVFNDSMNIKELAI